MAIFIMLHHVADNVNQTNDNIFLKKTSKFNTHGDTKRRNKKFYQENLL